jgi:hypothetical protein
MAELYGERGIDRRRTAVPKGMDGGLKIGKEGEESECKNGCKYVGKLTNKDVRR